MIISVGAFHSSLYLFPAIRTVALFSLSLPCFPLFVRVCTEYMVGRCGRLRFSRVPTFSQSTPVTELCARPVHRYAPDHRPGISTIFYFSSPSVRY